MRKLNLQELQVTSFVVNQDAESARGTVRAHSEVSTTTYYPPSWDGFCPTGDECVAQTNRPGTSCRPSCWNYTCEGATCGTLIC